MRVYVEMLDQFVQTLTEQKKQIITSLSVPGDKNPENLITHMIFKKP